MFNKENFLNNPQTTLFLGIGISCFSIAHADYDYQRQGPTQSYSYEVFKEEYIPQQQSPGLYRETGYYKEEPGVGAHQQSYRMSDRGMGTQTTGARQGLFISDPDLQKRVQDKIGSGWFTKGYEQVEVRVNNGIVTLQGPVKSWNDKEKLDREVRNIEGVRGLNSRVSVQENAQERTLNKPFTQDTAASPMDEQINKKIRDHISKGWLWDSHKDISLSTSNGMVTLDGTISNMKDEAKVLDEIQKIEGVKGVKSNLRMKNHQASPSTQKNY